LLIKRFLCCAFLLVVLICLYGCPFESEFPLSQSSEAIIDTQLLGKWKLEPQKGEEPGTLMIYQFNDHEYLILAKGEDEKDTDGIRAFSTTIDGHTFLNIQDIKGPGEKKQNWEFLNYSFSNNKLVIKVVLGEIFEKKKCASSKELFTCMQENLTNKALYNQDLKQIFSRIDEWQNNSSLLCTLFKKQTSVIFM